MFVVFCPRHGSRVLLFPDNIQALINQPAGIELHWQCTCGHTGVNHRRPTRIRLNRDVSRLPDAA